MTVKLKVVRSGTWTNPIFDELLGRHPGVDLDVFAIAGADEDGWSKLAQAHVYHLMASRDDLPARWHVTDELLQRCPKLLCVSSSGAGYDTIDVEACTKAGVAVVNQAGGNAMSVAEQAFGMMIAVSRRLCEQDRRLRSGERFSREDVMGSDISGKVLGLVGMGHIGTRMASLARAFNMTILATDPYLSAQEIEQRGAVPVPMHELLARCDIVSLHCPRNKETVGMFDAAAFKAMKPGALFITTARGGIHDEAALAQALQAGHLRGAGLDVWSVEPPPADHPLLGMGNVVATHHTAGVSHEARYNIAKVAAEQIALLAGGEKPPRLVNPEVWPVYTKRFRQALL
ncbi:hydroxyacid dehydrogenase|uniref:hydroxyacid dehydrogenase n=1 Tax=Noviherbaspirillum sp. L7-7A TaxID=2850560 RepID=UPI001C2B7D98|nr:hydroxyacid dehydrogenase [Noviherbaspirillum sp. L7-7A]MBV0878942.1 hydroxyacid dehydrogenase [Noviherbaspirillum sp. L7-7A]